MFHSFQVMPRATMLAATALACLLTSLIPPFALAAESLGFRVPENFDVSLYAGDDLAHDIFSMTIDARGRVVVSGRGYIKILEDTDGDGAADKAIPFASFPKGGAYGLYATATNVVCVGDDGVWSLADTNGDGRADGDPKLLLQGALQRGHSANGIVRGPDGWFYLACGNDAGINESHALLPSSPVKKPNGGSIVRFPVDGQYSEVVADGLRNPYDLAFSDTGNLFTVDADGERDRHLPWYSPNRLFDIAQGAHHGWVLKGWTHAWNRPAYWPDVAPRVDEIGRGSPTGMLVYRHRSFPERYNSGVFSMCWTYGRIYFFPLIPERSSFRTEREIFLETTGETGFAPVAMEIGPSGNMFVAIGGRGTRGSVFRVRYKDALRPQPAADDLLRRVLSADQPLASWSRATWKPLTTTLKRETFESAASNIRFEIPIKERLRALEILVEVYGGITPMLAQKCLLATEPELSARAVWALSRSLDQLQEPAAHQFFANATHHRSPIVKRAAFEAIAALPTHIVQLDPEPDWKGGLGNDDPRVRAATVRAARGPGIISFENIYSHSKQPTTHRRLAGYYLAFGPIKGPADFPANGDWTEAYLDGCADIISKAATKQTRQEAARAIQVALGDVKITQDKAQVGDGYVAAAPDRVRPALRKKLAGRLAKVFPVGHDETDRELARVLAMLQVEDGRLLSRMAAVWSDGAPLEGDIHFLLAAAHIGGERSPYFTDKSARSLALLHHKMNHEERDPSRFWPARIAAAYQRLQEQDPNLAGALIDDDAFGLPEHALFATLMPQEEKQRALRKLLARTSRPNPFDEQRWTPNLVAALRELSADEALPPLRKLWDEEPALRDSIAMTLAAHADPADRALLIASLESLQAGVVEAAAKTLAGFDPQAKPEELTTVFRALRRLTLNKNDRAVRAALVKLLETWSDQTIKVEEGSDLRKAYRPWFEWFAKTHPEQANSVRRSGGADVAKWEERLKGLTLTGGDAERGKTIYQQRSCHTCHGGTSRLGPNLKGAASRFSPRDLFLAIVDPSRDVSPAYHTRTVTTRSGESYTGVMIYDSPAAKLIQTSADTTVRVLAEDFEGETISATSLMPAGLLEGLTDPELADLYAYLKTIGVN